MRAKIIKRTEETREEQLLGTGSGDDLLTEAPRAQATEENETTAK